MPKLHLLKRNKPKEVYHLVHNESREKVLKSKLNRYHPYDISEALLSMDETERQKVYTKLNIKRLAKVFEHISVEKAADLIMEIQTKQAAEIISLMDIDDAVDILQKIKQDDAIKFLSLLDDTKRDQVRRLSKYRNLTAGSEMNSDFIKLSPKMGVKDAMKILVEQAEHIEMIDTMFVVDANDTLLGVVDLKDLIVAKHPKTVESIMSSNFYFVNVLDGIQEVVKDIQKYDTLAMPVLNDSNKIEGILTMYDAMDIIEETAHDDYAKLAGLPTEDDIYDNARSSAKKRLPWLTLLLFLNLIVSSVLASYEETIAAIAVLVLFQPMILDMAGNIGTQSLGVTILRISKETLRSRVSVVSHVLTEWLVGIINGILLGILAFLTSWFLLTFLPIGEISGTITPIRVAVVVSLSIFAALSVSALLGSLIPVILNKMKIDPAVASGPFITTINDVTALMVYFTLASLMLISLL